MPGDAVRVVINRKQRAERFIAPVGHIFITDKNALLLLFRNLHKPHHCFSWIVKAVDIALQLRWLGIEKGIMLLRVLFDPVVTELGFLAKRILPQVDAVKMA